MGDGVAGFLSVSSEQWAAIGAGLAIGLVARWAYILSNGERLTWRAVLIDCMALAPNALLAIQLPGTIHLPLARLMLMSAMLSSASTTAFVRALKAIGNRGDNTATVFTSPGAGMNVPAHTPVSVHTVPTGPSSPQTVGEVFAASLSNTPPELPSGELIHILGRIPDEI